MCEARISEGTEQLIEQNRAEYDTVLSRATQPPPQKVCVASVHIEHAVSYVKFYNILPLWFVILFSDKILSVFA